MYSSCHPVYSASFIYVMFIEVFTYPKINKNRHRKKKLKVEHYGDQSTLRCVSGVRGFYFYFINSSSLRLVVLLIFTFGLIHGVER